MRLLRFKSGWDRLPLGWALAPVGVWEPFRRDFSDASALSIFTVRCLVVSSLKWVLKVGMSSVEFDPLLPIEKLWVLSCIPVLRCMLGMRITATSCPGLSNSLRCGFLLIFLVPVVVTQPVYWPFFFLRENCFTCTCGLSVSMRRWVQGPCHHLEPESFGICISLVP